MHRALRFIAVCGAVAASMMLCGCREAGQQHSKVTIGFVVKQPEEPWFQLEWRFAQQAADELGFELITIGGTDGEKTLTALDNLAARGADGVIICTPDVRLGPAIVNKCTLSGLKLMTVDDELVGGDGAFLDVHHMGISASEIGKLVGRSLFAEMTRRGWKAAETGLCVVTFKELDTARERTDGAVEAMLAAGYPKDRVFETAQRTTDVPGAFDAVNVLLTQHADIRKWLICGLNDEAVLGGVRAMEGIGVGAGSVIGIGIGGTTGVAEFRKDAPTGFFASVLLSPRRHGYETAQLMYRWITEGVEPPKTTYTAGMLITRDTFESVMREQGLLDEIDGK